MEFQEGPSSGPLLAAMVPDSLNSYDFVGTVGGVAFRQIASPEAGFQPNRIEIDYDSSQADGFRLRIRFDGIPCVSLLPDWLLIPIAGYADSEFNATVSLFGTQTTDSTYDIVFHPSLKDTLLGLRLLQCDLLLISMNDTWDLPSQNGFAPLGSGEKSIGIRRVANGIRLDWQGGLLARAPTPLGPFTVQANATNPMTNDAVGSPTFFRIATHRFDPASAAAVSSAIGNADFQSWVLTDHDAKVEFGVREGSLRLTGQPYYHFWNADWAAYDAEYNRLSALAEAALPDIERYNAIVAQINALEPRVYPIEDATRRLRLQSEPLKAFNPVTFAASETTMRFSAFFRYVKARNPTGWSEFVRKTRGTSPKPDIVTPTKWKPSF